MLTIIRHKFFLSFGRIWFFTNNKEMIKIFDPRFLLFETKTKCISKGGWMIIENKFSGNLFNLDLGKEILR